MARVAVCDKTRTLGRDDRDEAKVGLPFRMARLLLGEQFKGDIVRARRHVAEDFRGDADGPAKVLISRNLDRLPPIIVEIWESTAPSAVG